ncbi:gephyrin-like molybdotransferase Glp [Promicromonospora sp. Populi]|uniref:molybdopterin molybdotransferase MoeA n=1 Tax=Promicromonospora sp. Populi TaxID=3239420 RepID=UPI0034E26B63
MGDRVDVEQHRADVAELLAGLTDRPTETMPVYGKLVGRLLAADLVAPGPLPRFRNSQMDGFAVRAADVASAAPGAPVTLPVVGDVAAAPGEPAPLEPGTAVRIMTGAPVPDGADTVIPVEDTDHRTFNSGTFNSGTSSTAAHNAAKVVITRGREAGEFVREAGSDVAEGAVVLRAGTVLAPHHVAAAAACGIDTLHLRAPVLVAIVSTGSELVPPGGEAGPGQVWDANGQALAAAVHAAGGRVELHMDLPDDPETARAGLAQAARQCDLVLTTGGVSQGAYEVVKDALPEVTFRSVAMQPGGPQGLGRLDGTPVLTFPGNPVSAQVSFVVFLRDVLRRAGGLPPVEQVSAVLDDAVGSPAGKRQLLRGRWVRDDGAAGGALGGAPRVAVVGGPGSHLVASMAAADVLIDVPAATTKLEPGADVVVWPL